MRKRQSIRLRDYDYRSCGAYFVTVCTFQREPLFGTIEGGEVRLTEAGRVLKRVWARCVNSGALPQPHLFVVMPNHVHGIVWLTGHRSNVRTPDVGARRPPCPPWTPTSNRPTGPNTHPALVDASPLQRSGALSHSLGARIGAFKSQAAHAINALRETPGTPVWQRNYYERIIRNEDELARIRQYILDNPAKWPEDPNNVPASP